MSKYLSRIVYFDVRWSTIYKAREEWRHLNARIVTAFIDAVFPGESN